MSARFDIRTTSISGLQVLQRQPIGDERGFLERLFCQTDLAEILHGKTIQQVNRTLTEKIGAVRGMHFQHPPHAETKFVMCLKGEIYDVAVDVRAGSPTFLHWHAEILSAANHKTLVIPEGFAHGFQTLANGCELLYFHTAAYQARAEAALNALDPRLAIQWPLPITEQSERDRAHPLIEPDFQGIMQ